MRAGQAGRPRVADRARDREPERDVPRVEQQAGDHRGHRAPAGRHDRDHQELRAAREDQHGQRHRQQRRHPGRRGERAERHADHPDRRGEGERVADVVALQGSVQRTHGQ
ncbi:hypothetical protein BJF78_22910 [Pseudonocardia sp. CNS-139]|nr:hypothetical protein BJF78_22910 [Pseudonocardia sp. CNS-139]